MCSLSVRGQVSHPGFGEKLHLAGDNKSGINLACPMLITLGMVNNATGSMVS